MNILLWIIQIVLALLFLFAGGTKLVLSSETLTSMGSPNQVVLPVWFIRFIGVAEVLGALGLVLPGLFRRQQHLDRTRCSRTHDHHDRRRRSHNHG